LSIALDSRIVIEQAKGKVAQATGTGMDDAFNRLRSHARNHNMGLTSVASMVVEGSLSGTELDVRGPAKRH
jgi:AmiR/NasT family two-component response regulator